MGISLFKRTLVESNPDAESVLSPAGAYVLGSFVEPDAALAATDGVVIQNTDGSVSVAVRSDRVVITVGAVKSITVQDGRIDIDTPEFYVNGTQRHP